MSMQIIDYLALSQLAYVNFTNDDTGQALGKIIDMANDENSGYQREGLNPHGSTLAPLQSPSNPLRSYILLNFTQYSSSGFSAIALQNPDTKEIVFAFRGTDNLAGADALADAAIAFFIPSYLVPQLNEARQFVFDTLNKYGPTCYDNQESMFNSLNQHSNVSFTGHSLGGGLAQYMTYVTSDMDLGDTGVKSVTFNGVSIGQNTWDQEIWAHRQRYTSVNHVNSGDVTGNFGVSLGVMVHHIDGKDGIAAQHVDIEALSALLVCGVHLQTRDEPDMKYLAKIKEVVKSLKTKGAAVYDSTMAAFRGYFEPGGIGIARYHGLDALIDKNTGRITQTISENKSILSQLDIETIGALAGAISVVERAKQEGNYTAAALEDSALAMYWQTYRLSAYGAMTDALAAALASSQGYSYTTHQIMYANSILRHAGRYMENKSFEEAVRIYKKAIVAPRVDPLIFDLNGDGFVTTRLEDSRTYFDLDANGFAERTAWVDARDGLLVLDRNEDGMITNGQELFGDQTVLINGGRATSGFEALAEFDINKDGRIDAKDVVYAKLKMWQDANQDGISQAEEMKSLADVGISVIHLNSTSTSVTDVMGNVQRRQGSFVRADGANGGIAEYLLNRDTVDSRDLFGGVMIPDDIAALPNVQGAGNVSSLHTAMVRDDSGALKQLVLDFIDPTNASRRDQIFTDILYAWTGSSAIDPKSRGGLVDARQLAVLEKFMGTSFAGTNGTNPNSNAAPMLQKAYDNLTDRLYASLASESFLKDVVGGVDFRVTDADIEINLAKAQSIIDAEIVADAATGKQLLSSFLRVMRGYGLGKDSAFWALCDYFIAKSPELAPVVYSADRDIISGTSAKESLFGTAGNDIIYGGAGDDSMNGGEGDDTYIFSRGDGADFIYETSGVDTIRLAGGISPDDVAVKLIDIRSGEVALEVAIKDTDDKLLISCLGGMQYQIERILFADGTVWGATEIYHRTHNTYGTDNAESWYAFDDAPFTYHGLGGNDYINGGVADDKLHGDDGDDGLYGKKGNDILSGGAGNDQLYGDDGDDVYLFNRGDGSDIVHESSGVDTVRFGDDINPNDISLRAIATGDEDVSLEVAIQDSKDKLIIDRHFGTWNYYDHDRPLPQHQIERIAFSDGTVWDLAEIERRAYEVRGTDGEDEMSAVGTRSVTYYGEGGNDTLNGSLSDDKLYGGSGDDVLNGGGGGNDVLVGGLGNDTFYSCLSNDTYVFNKGDGQDYINDYEGVDIIQLGEGIRPEDIILNQIRNGDNYDLEINLGGGDRLTVGNYFEYCGVYGETEESFSYAIEEVRFADGTVWTPQTLRDILHIQTGTDGNDTIIIRDNGDVNFRGMDGDDTLCGASGHDTLSGGDGNDILNGRAGNDILYGDDGNDSIYGEGGNDQLFGGAGDDIYTFNKGDRSDIINEYSGNDEIRLDYSAHDVLFSRQDYSLVMQMNNSSDMVTIKSWYYSDGAKIETIKSADGQVMTYGQVENLIQAMASFQKDTGLSWEQALTEHPDQARSIIQEYWTAPTA